MRFDAGFRRLRRDQLKRALGPLLGVSRVARPPAGWLAAIREAQGISLREVSLKLSISPQAVMKLQNSEASESITLRRLREVAEAMGCDLVYAVVPKNGRLIDQKEDRNRKLAAERVLSAEHTMLLENQAVGDVTERIQEEQERT